MSDNGKGDTTRPTDRSKFDPEYNRLFGSEEEIKKRRRAYIEEQKAKRGKITVQTLAPTWTAESFESYAKHLNYKADRS